MADKLLLDLFQAYYDARLNKRNNQSALEFEINYESNLFELYQELRNGTYQIGRSIAFIVFKPVKREIIASPFRDRIIHHLVFNYISPMFEENFINDSYSCRLGKGTSYGIKRIYQFIKACSSNYQKECYVLKLDLSGYFMSINQQKLYDKIYFQVSRDSKKINFDFDLVLDLIRKIIFHNYTNDCIIRGGRHDWTGLPRNKSLFFKPEGVGLPIGNLTSQLFSNIYLNDFDHYIKRKLMFKYYGRYVDDLIIIDKDLDKLKSAILRIKVYLSKFELKLHPKKIYLQPVKRGVIFLGVVIKPWRLYICRQTKNNFRKKVAQINSYFILTKKKDVSKKKLVQILTGINSYLGMIKHYQTFNLRSKIIKEEISRVCWRYYQLGKDLSRLSQGKNLDIFQKINLKKNVYK